MSDIFVSYSRKDKSRAKVLVQLLKQNRWSVWWDPEILHGKKFRDVIQHELDAARCVIVLWSETSVESEWVLDEAGDAKDRLVPVLIDKVKIPHGFSQRQAAELIDWNGDQNHPEFQKLLRSLASMLGQSSGIQYRQTDASTNQGVANYHYNLGLELASEKKYEEAEAEYRMAIKIYPDDSTYHWYLAYALNEQNKSDEAAVEYRESIRIDPNDASARNNLGLILYRKGQYTEAEAEYREAIRLEPNKARYHNNLGDALAKQAPSRPEQNKPAPGWQFGSSSEIEDTLEYPPHPSLIPVLIPKQQRRSSRIIEIPPDLGDLLAPKESFVTRLHQGVEADDKWKEAEAEYRKAVQLDPTNDGYHNDLGDALQAQARYAEAEAEYREASKLDPDHAKYHRNLGDALKAQSRTEEAEAEYKEASRLSPFLYGRGFDLREHIK